MAFSIRSSAFQHNGSIPMQYTCEGSDTSPPLAWSEVPEGAKSLALIVDDPDAPDPKAPKMVYVHWVVYNIPASNAGSIDEGVTLPSSVVQGINDWKKEGYGGPCPPIGRHRYFFTLYALDTTISDLGAATKPQLEAAMHGHILEQAVLVGTYEKSK
jgi:Raf kinase inhibitor-like YbhB/YbcL family protein